MYKYDELISFLNMNTKEEFYINLFLPTKFYITHFAHHNSQVSAIGPTKEKKETKHFHLYLASIQIGNKVTCSSTALMALYFWGNW